ncbi:hypothetical protein NYV40_18470 [Escherichia coli]|nr:hypothetical protein [Escherichia coli]
MNTKRVAAMRHRRLTLKKSEKGKEKKMVIEAAAYAAAIATANAIRIHDEEVEQKYPVMFITEYDQHEALLKIRGTSFEGILADKLHRASCQTNIMRPYESRLIETGRSKDKQQLVEMIKRYYKSSFKPTASHEVVMREVPKMSVEKSHAISRRMFARTAEDMAQELYDDAE